MSKIIKVKARQVFDSRGNPTIEAEVFTKNNSALAICPSGASTGTYEAFEKRDKNNKRYLGKSVLNAVNLINTKLPPLLEGPLPLALLLISSFLLSSSSLQASFSGRVLAANSLFYNCNWKNQPHKSAIVVVR